jgi:hypothetical protein
MDIEAELNKKLKQTTEDFRNTRQRCVKCGVLEGEFHKIGCGWERCSCGEQLLACLITGKCDDKERVPVPFVLYPNLCRRCGQIFPLMFDVSDAEWTRYVEISQRKEMLCFGCFSLIRKWTDGTETVDTRIECLERMMKFLSGSTAGKMGKGVRAD